MFQDSSANMISGEENYLYMKAQTLLGQDDHADRATGEGELRH